MNKQFSRIIKRCLRFVPDRLYLQLRYFVSFKKPLNLKNPVTYSEKLQWLKLYDRNPLYNQLADKYAVRSFVAERIGEEHLIPIYGVWDRYEDIDFDQLPDQFVLKCTHDSGSVRICRSKSGLDMKQMKRHFTEALQNDQYYGGREWAYKNIKGRILAEKVLSDGSDAGIRDYKFFCFNGKVKALFVATDRGVCGQDVKFDFFDENFNHLPFTHGHENALVTPSKPHRFEEMIKIAEKLSQNMRHARVDLYNIDGKIYFGEITFYHHCGFVPFDPEEWDEIMGSWLVI